MRTETAWKGLPADIRPYAGFVYEIENLLNGRKYIGKKFFWYRRRKKMKGRKNRKMFLVTSDWKTYKSSSKELLVAIDLQGEKEFRFTILRCLTTRRDVNYYETKLQFEYDVLHKRLPSGEYAYYNANIMRKFFR